MKPRSFSSRRGIAKIIMATMAVIFSLFACTSGTYAWFLNRMNFETNSELFQVGKMEGVEIESISLIKFDYNTVVVGGIEEIDYLAPQRGSVNEYDYQPSHGQFGYYSGLEWIPVDVMNVYDPLLLEITGADLFELNCNAIFKVVLSSDSISTGQLSCSAHLKTGIVPNSRQVLISDCVDFDLYFPSDLSDETTFDGNPHRPSYYASLSGDAETKDEYYRVSYLASLPEENHAHFYGGLEKPSNILLSDDPIDLPDITFVDGKATVYVNVNYSSAATARFSSHIVSGETIRALYDYYLSFHVE